MAQYIYKDAVVAEIEKRKKEAESNCGGYKSYDEHRCNACVVDFYEEFLEILDTLEVKEVDLDGEIDLWVRNLHRVPNFEELNKFARHFFELGLKAAQKGE